MKVIGVVGLPASGKGEVSEVAKKIGVPVVVMGDAIRRACAEKGIPPTDENLGAMATRLRQELGRDIIARLTIPEIESAGGEVVLVDGIRSEAEVRAFRDHFADFLLIGIESSFDDRFERLRSRRRSDDPASREELELRDSRELGWGLGNALRMADITIRNERSLSMFREKVRNVLLDAGA
ncbi:MAG: AAA family ATPase [Methanomicrobiaceae archaeon]|nr:AAA family ATPase [Methanomicrobiaceae archaeon]